MATIRVEDETFTVSRATREGVADLAALLADDILGKDRESVELDIYLAAFDEIEADPHQYLAVVKDARGAVCGTFQLTLIPGLARGGSKRLQIEAVRLAPATRNKGLGAALFTWAHDWGTRSWSDSRAAHH